MLLMFMTGLVPFATYALPAAAGIVLISVQIEIGFGTALLVYFAASFLSLFVCPDREAALMFICFFGYYPTLRFKLENIRQPVLKLFIKLAIFVVTMIGSYEAVIYILGIPDPLDQMYLLGCYGKWCFLALGCFVFLFYDKAIRNIVYLYCNWFRPKYLGIPK